MLKIVAKNVRAGWVVPRFQIGHQRCELRTPEARQRDNISQSIRPHAPMRDERPHPSKGGLDAGPSDLFSYSRFSCAWVGRPPASVIISNSVFTSVQLSPN